MVDTESFSEQRDRLRREIPAVTPDSFESLALRIFRFQATYNPVYRNYVETLGRDPSSVNRLEHIPFLPIAFFKTHRVVTGDRQGQVFESSGTTGTTTSRHEVYDLSLYEEISVRIFEENYGPLENFHILALLPSYLERNNSSLVYMVQHFMQKSDSAYSGFYLDDFDALNRKLTALASRRDQRKILLIGVTFALLDWVEKLPEQWPELMVMETGGMKGRRKELLRQEVHEILKSSLGVSAIHSEYGMTELVSQAYSSGEGIFNTVATLRIFIRDITDPFSFCDAGVTGGVNIIDLGNLDSCSFIETSDLGRTNGDTFEIMGRIDNSDIRGCNLLYV